MNTSTSVDRHEDLRRQARNALAAYMHHVLYDKTGGKDATGVIHACADHCIKYAMGILDKAVVHIEAAK